MEAPPGQAVGGEFPGATSRIAVANQVSHRVTLRKPGPDKAARVMNAFMQMKKLDIATLKRAAG